MGCGWKSLQSWQFNYLFLMTVCQTQKKQNKTKNKKTKTGNQISLAHNITHTIKSILVDKQVKELHCFIAAFSIHQHPYEF